MQQRMQELQATFTSRLQITLNQLDQCLEALLADLPADDRREALSSLHRLAHTMAGSSASFGYETLGAAAQDLEIIGASQLSNGQSIDPAALSDIKRLVGEIKSAATAGPDKTFD